jgi:hypothetical protein
MTDLLTSKLAQLTERLDAAEAEIQRLKNISTRRWLSPAEVQKQSQGKYLAHQVRRQIQMAIDTPGDSPLRIGEHFTIEAHEHRRTMLVNYPEYDKAMVLEMKAVAHA